MTLGVVDKTPKRKAANLLDIKPPIVEKSILTPVEHAATFEPDLSSYNHF